MTLFRKLALGIFAISFSLNLSACASKLPHMDAMAEDAGFGLLTEESDFGAFHGKLGGPMMGLFIKDLNLSDAQKTQLKNLFVEAHQNNSHKEGMKKTKNAIKQAFLSEQFDKAALQAQISSNLPDTAGRSQTMANDLLKAWQILTPEQQSKVKDRLDKIEQKMQDWQNKGQQFTKGPHADRIQALMQSLQVSEEQKIKLQAIWDAGKNERQEHFANMKGLKVKIIAELSSPQPSTERLAALIAPVANKARSKMDKHLDKFAAVHQILNSNQRQQLVSLMEQKMKNHPHGFGKGFRNHH